MADFPGDNYAPPGVYVDTVLENPSASVSNGTLLPVLIGVGRETLDRNNFEVVRGSSAAADTPVVDEDLTGRACRIASAWLLGRPELARHRLQRRKGDCLPVRTASLALGNVLLRKRRDCRCYALLDSRASERLGYAFAPRFHVSSPALCSGGEDGRSRSC